MGSGGLLPVLEGHCLFSLQWVCVHPVLKEQKALTGLASLWWKGQRKVS